MRLEEMKNKIPETPKFIHEMIQSEVKKQIQNAEVIQLQAGKRNKRFGAKVAAAAAVCVLAASTTAYAGVRLYHIFLEKQGTYSAETKIKAEGSMEQKTLPEKIHDIYFSAGYVPEGMEWTDELHLEYPEHNQTGGFSFSSVLLDKNDLDKAMQDTSVLESEKRMFGRYEGVYLKYHNLAEDGSFNQKIYLLRPDLYRVITIYIGDDVAKEDAVKVAENLKITETDTMMETAGMDTWSEQVSPVIEEAGEMAAASVAEDKLPVRQIGETFDMEAAGEDGEGNFAMDHKIAVRVDSIQINDDLRALDPDLVPEEWKGAVGADGKLVNNTLSYIKSGDGVNSVDEVVKTESAEQKLVCATVTYANTSDQKISHMLFFGTLMLINQEDGAYQIYDPRELSGDDYDRIAWDGVARAAEMTYKSVSDHYGDGGNYIPSLQAGETIQVKMAWIVNENDLAHMYLGLAGDASAYEFTDEALKTGVVDIRQ